MTDVLIAVTISMTGGEEEGERCDISTLSVQYDHRIVHCFLLVHLLKVTCASPEATNMPLSATTTGLFNLPLAPTTPPFLREYPGSFSANTVNIAEWLPGGLPAHDLNP